MKTIMIICSQKAMGVEGAEDICDYTAILWVFGRSFVYNALRRPTDATKLDGFQQ